MNAVHYAALIGQYVVATRPSTTPEKWSKGDPVQVMEGTVVSVQDDDAGNLVIGFESGIGYTIELEPTGHIARNGWAFQLFRDEQAARMFR